MADRHQSNDPNLCDSKTKYFFTKPFWAHGVRLKQARNPNTTYMDESAVRARAGVINMLAWGVLLCSFVIPQYTIIIYAGPFIIYDMLSGVAFGLTPFCPTGVLGTMLAWRVKPFYAPSKPKKFAWTLGAIMAGFCVFLRLYIGRHWSVRAINGLCILLTFAESSLGFCLGCWMFGYLRRVRCCVGCCDRKSAPSPASKPRDRAPKKKKKEGRQSDITETEMREQAHLKITISPRDSPTPNAADTESGSNASRVSLEMHTPSPAEHEDDNICSA